MSALASASVTGAPPVGIRTSQRTTRLRGASDVRPQHHHRPSTDQIRSTNGFFGRDTYLMIRSPSFIAELNVSQNPTHLHLN
jgi:hypothetical protein